MPKMSHKCKISGLAAILIALLVSHLAYAQVELGGALVHPGFDADHTSIVVADASSGKVLASHLPNLKLNPASCAKILTSVTALARLGSDYRFKTYLLSDEKPKRGEIDTLYIRGGGDPSLINEDLEEIAARLYASGLRRIEKGIVIDNSFFDSFDYPRKGGNAGRAYTAMTSALAVNFNAIGIEVSPGRAGARAKVELKPPVDIYRLKNRVVTSGKTNLSIAMKSWAEGDEIVVSGRISPRSETRVFWRAVPDPVAYAAAVIRHIFGEAGISVAAAVRSGPVPKDAYMLAEVESEPLLEIVRNMNKLSTNFVAEELVKHMGGVFKGEPGSTEKGVEVIEEYLASLGIPKGSLVLENGSGLSSISKVSADQLVKVLVATYQNRSIQYDFMSTLSVLGVDGTMKRWKRMEPELTGIVYAKTGTLDSVSTLAGYVPMKNGQLAAFAILANGLPKGPWQAKKAQLGVVKRVAGVNR